MSKNKAAKKTVAGLASRKVQQTDEYWAAYERFKRIEPIDGIATNCLTPRRGERAPPLKGSSAILESAFAKATAPLLARPEWR